MPKLFTLFILLLSISQAFARTCDTADQQVHTLQTDWAYTKYKIPVDARLARFDSLQKQLETITQAYPACASAYIWRAVVINHIAELNNAPAALELAKQSRKLLETGLELDAMVLNGYGYIALGGLYYEVPVWPISFGDTEKAHSLLSKALAIDPAGMDANFFYAHFLIQQDREKEAIPYLRKALVAPESPGVAIAYDGRRNEIRMLLKELGESNN